MRDIESERRQREEVLQQKRDDLKARQSQLSTTNHHRAQLEQAITRAKEKTYQLRYSSLMIIMFAVGSFEVFLPKVSYLLFIYLPSVMPADRKLGSHAYSRLCSDLSRLVEKFEPLQQ